MKFRRVVFSETARQDLEDIALWIAEAGAPITALRYVRRLREQVIDFCRVGMIGTARDDIAPGLRHLGLLGANVVFRVDEERSTVLRVYYGGQNWETKFGRGR